MAQPRRVTVTLPDGRKAEAVEVPVLEAKEPWCEYKLEDGTIARAKINLVTMLRVENEYDQQGAPIYQVNATMAMGILEVPEHLKKGGRPQ